MAFPSEIHMFRAADRHPEFAEKFLGVLWAMLEFIPVLEIVTEEASWTQADSDDERMANDGVVSHSAAACVATDVAASTSAASGACMATDVAASQSAEIGVPDVATSASAVLGAGISLKSKKRKQPAQPAQREKFKCDWCSKVRKFVNWDTTDSAYYCKRCAEL
jgi:hypothetical protein